MTGRALAAIVCAVLVALPARAEPPRAALEATFDALLAAAAADDRARFDALLGPEATLVGADEGRPADFARLRRYARECHRIGARAAIVTDPPTHIATYACNDRRGFELYGAFTVDGARLLALRVDGPGPTVAELADEERVAAMGRAYTARMRSAIPATFDALFDAARRGDETAFAARLAVRESPVEFEDDAFHNHRHRRLTLAGLRPIALRCRRIDEPGGAQPMGPHYNGANYLCDGRRGYQALADFTEDGSQIRQLWIRGPHPDRDRRETARARHDLERWRREEGGYWAAYEARLAARLDALLAVARDGDEARFEALLSGPGPDGRPDFGDWRTLRSGGPTMPLTLARLRPFALVCRREEGHSDTTTGGDNAYQDMPFACGGESGYLIRAGFAGQQHLVSLVRIEGPNRQHHVH